MMNPFCVSVLWVGSRDLHDSSWWRCLWVLRESSVSAQMCCADGVHINPAQQFLLPTETQTPPHLWTCCCVKQIQISASRCQDVWNKRSLCEIGGSAVMKLNLKIHTTDRLLVAVISVEHERTGRHFDGIKPELDLSLFLLAIALLDS